MSSVRNMLGIGVGESEKQLSTLNDTIRFFVLYLNVLFLLLGLLLIAVAFYLIFADWGSLDKNFFVGAGVVVILLGFVIFLVSGVGFVGVVFNLDYKGGTIFDLVSAVTE
jgi:hypothetical protein